MSDSPVLDTPPCQPAWAHQHGVMSLGPVTQAPTDLTDLADRFMIQETAYRYALAYDERRLDVLADVFTSDLSFMASLSGEVAGKLEGRDAVVDYLHEVMQGQNDQRRHVCSNPVIEHLDGDSAAITVYMSIFASDTETRLVTTGFYEMKLRKLDNKWRINSLCVGLDRPF